jgi:hypothetical protein
VPQEEPLEIFELRPAKRALVKVGTARGTSRPRGVRLLHLGDALVNQSGAYLRGHPFEQSPVDVLFLNQYDRSHTTQQFVAEKIKPSRIIAMHVPPAALEEERKKIRAAYPHAIVFEQSMERRALPIEVDLHNLPGDSGQTPRTLGTEVKPRPKPRSSSGH